MKKSYILASVVSLTLAGAAPVAFAQRDGRGSDRYEIRSENKMAYSQVPGDVKRVIEPQLNSGDKVTDVYTFKRGDRTIYVATTNDERIIRADDKGNLLNIRSTDDDSDRERKAVKYAGLPGDVKNTLGKEGKGHPMEIFQVTRDGKTFYVANIEEQEGTRRVRVDADGKLMGQPVLLSDRGDDRNRDRLDNRDERNRDRDDIDSRRRQDRTRFNTEGEKLTFNNLPGEVKQTVGAEMGRDKVTEVLRIKRDARTLYRVDIEGDDRARTIWVDDQGKMVRELNDTEEGRTRVEYANLPGDVKSALIKEAHNQEPKRVWQVTRGRDTWYVAEANDGHLIRIDSSGKVMSHDSHPKLLSNRNDNERNRDRDNVNRDRDNNARDRDRDNNTRNDNVLQRNRDDVSTNANERNRNRDNNANASGANKFEKMRDLDKDNDGKIDGVKVNFGDLPNDVKQTIRDETKSGEKISAIYKVNREGGAVHYIVETDDDRYIRVGEHGGLLGQTK